jgi:hypothetical protein
LTVPPYTYEVVNYVSGYNSDALKIFPAERDAITIALPFRLSWPTFGPDGKSLYGIVVSHPTGIAGDQSGLSKIEFNPTRVSPVPGTEGFQHQKLCGLIALGQDRHLWPVPPRKLRCF